MGDRKAKQIELKTARNNVYLYSILKKFVLNKYIVCNLECGISRVRVFCPQLHHETRFRTHPKCFFPEVIIHSSMDFGGSSKPNRSTHQRDIWNVLALVGHETAQVITYPTGANIHQP